MTYRHHRYGRWPCRPESVGQRRPASDGQKPTDICSHRSSVGMKCTGTVGAIQWRLLNYIGNGQNRGTQGTTMSSDLLAQGYGTLRVVGSRQQGNVAGRRKQVPALTLFTVSGSVTTHALAVKNILRSRMFDKQNSDRRLPQWPRLATEVPRDQHALGPMRMAATTT
jgi:hypothetical protein